MTSSVFLDLSQEIANQSTFSQQANLLLGRVVSWLQAPDESSLVKTARKILAIFLAVAFSCTVIGIIPVAMAVSVWRKHGLRENAIEILPSLLLQSPNLSREVEERSQSSIEHSFEELNFRLVSSQTFDDEQVIDDQAERSFSTSFCKRLLPVEKEEIFSKQHLLEAVCGHQVDLLALDQANLLPLGKIPVGNAVIHCSKVFLMNKGHYAVVAFVEVNQKLYPQVFYHSNSQGTWRVIPYALKDEEQTIRHYGKGPCESFTELPISVSLALNALPFIEAKPTSYLVGNLVQTLSLESSNLQFDGEVELAPSMFLENDQESSFYQMGRRIPKTQNPRNICLPIDARLYPDFQSREVLFEQVIPHYGIVATRIVFSVDRSLQYLFYEASDGKAFLACVEKQDTQINSFGVRKESVALENMDAPLLEYGIQIPNNYHPRIDRVLYYQSHEYKSNWNYVRELPIIQLYYAKQNRKLPDPI